MKLARYIIILTVILFFSCNIKDKNIETRKVDSIMEVIDFENLSVVKINDKLFSVPSPIQIAILTKELGIEYNKNILNSSKKYFAYNTSFTQALNLGVYGADLAYVNIYENKNIFTKNLKLLQKKN